MAKPMKDKPRDATLPPPTGAPTTNDAPTVNQAGPRKAITALQNIDRNLRELDDTDRKWVLATLAEWYPRTTPTEEVSDGQI